MFLISDNNFFMDPPPVLSSAFPLPPMGYIELFSDDNIRQNNKILQPPPPIEVKSLFSNLSIYRNSFRVLMNYSVFQSMVLIIPNQLFDH
jgi:hypothetical protein